MKGNTMTRLGDKIGQIDIHKGASNTGEVIVGILIFLAAITVLASCIN